MILAYVPNGTGLTRIEVAPGEDVPEAAVWIDLLRPTREEQQACEKLMGAEIPTRDEMRSIESSARFYEEPGGLVMTALLPIAARTHDPETSSVTFVLSQSRLVTVRHGEPVSITLFERKVGNLPPSAHSGPGIVVGLFEFIIDRCADVMEEASAKVDVMSQKVFEDGISARKSTLYKDAIKDQGRIGLQISKMHDVCTGLSRLLLFIDSRPEKVKFKDSQKRMLKTYGRDLHSIKEHGDALDNRLSYLLDATIGLVNLEQNQTAKTYSVLGLIFLPPTLVASIYGMNFRFMPELDWAYGFEYALAVMGGLVLVTYLVLRLRRLL
ncbi:magnesium transporter CorA family protein [Roseibium aestuarii]|uniref:Magnesium transporter CorA family protein n=1 Tax=Roseibium aestuarii TaxID=2600299 RepID=A0ABW4JTF9_9HYPH|nr:magnesium transporter CorA family protein [Roseibium aestuarii]